MLISIMCNLLKKFFIISGQFLNHPAIVRPLDDDATSQTNEGNARKVEKKIEVAMEFPMLRNESSNVARKYIVINHLVWNSGLVEFTRI